MEDVVQTPEEIEAAAAAKAIADAQAAADKAAKDAEKAVKAAEREAAKQAKAAEKAVKDAAKAAEKATKDAAKAEAKTAKDAERAAKAAAKPVKAPKGPTKKSITRDLMARDGGVTIPELVAQHGVSDTAARSLVSDVRNWGYAVTVTKNEETKLTHYHTKLRGDESAPVAPAAPAAPEQTEEEAALAAAQEAMAAAG